MPSLLGNAVVEPFDAEQRATDHATKPCKKASFEVAVGRAPSRGRHKEKDNGHHGDEKHSTGVNRLLENLAAGFDRVLRPPVQKGPSVGVVGGRKLRCWGSLLNAWCNSFFHLRPRSHVNAATL